LPLNKFKTTILVIGYFGVLMKLSKQIMSLVEDGLSGLSEQELKKFWKDIQENIFKASKEVKKNDLGLFYGSTEALFVDSKITKLELASVSPKEIVQMILNDYTLDRESTEEEDDQAFEYFLKNLKGQTVFFYGESEGSDSQAISFEGNAKIKNFKYNAQTDELIVTDHEIVNISIEDK
jgi:hypothetical protein